jgi:integrase/recombinase XerD
MVNNEILQNFIASLGVDKSINTLLSYESDITLLLKFLLDRKKGFLDCTQADLIEYFSEYFIKDKYNFIKIVEATTIRRKISCFRAFFGFLLDSNLIVHNPIEEIDIPKKALNLPFYLTEEETWVLFEYTNSLNTKDGIRNNAILHILYSGGLRISECITLLLSDVLFDDKIKKKVIILGKGNKERMVFFDKPTQQAVEKYLLVRDYFKPLPKNGYLFCSDSKSGYITRESVFMNLRKIAYTVSLPERLSPHKLRHSFATHLYQKGMDLRMLQILLGHSDISTTEIYTHIKADDIKNTVEKFHPMFNKK